MVHLPALRALKLGLSTCCVWASLPSSSLASGMEVCKESIRYCSPKSVESLLLLDSPRGFFDAACWVPSSWLAWWPFCVWLLHVTSAVAPAPLHPFRPPPGHVDAGVSPNWIWTAAGDVAVLPRRRCCSCSADSARIPPTGPPRGHFRRHVADCSWRPCHDSAGHCRRSLHDAVATPDCAANLNPRPMHRDDCVACAAHLLAQPVKRKQDKLSQLDNLRITMGTSLVCFNIENYLMVFGTIYKKFKYFSFEIH